MVESHKNKSKRVQLDLQPDAYEQLRELKARSGAKTYSEVFRGALNFYEWYLSTTKNKERVVVVSSDGTTREIVLL